MTDALVIRGEVVDPRADELDALQEEVKRLRRELAIANGEIAKAKGESARALGALRKQLSPLYRALQSVFGELDAAGVDDATFATNPTTPTRTTAIWANWKEKLPGYPARIIDALLLQSDLTTTQLAISCGCKRQRISDGIMKLNRAGLINKNGGKFSLKAL